MDKEKDFSRISPTKWVEQLPSVARGCERVTGRARAKGVGNEPRVLSVKMKG